MKTMTKSIDDFYKERKQASPHQPFFERNSEFNKQIEEGVNAVTEKGIPVLAVSEWLVKEVGVPLAVPTVKKYVTEKVKQAEDS